MLKKFLSENGIEAFFDESLKKHTTFRVGGNAVCIAVPDTAEKAALLIKFLNANDIKSYYLGNGSNVIFRDEGFDGVIVKSSGLKNIEISGNRVIAGAGVLMTALSKTLQENSLSGLEFCYGIPGNVGGGIYMNAGAYGGEISSCLKSVVYIDENGNIKTIDKENCRYSYRHSLFMAKKWFIVSAEFEMNNGDSTEMLAFMEDIMQRRRDKQPLDKPSAGSSFKRPPGSFAAALIDECGLKGLSVGGARVSEKHAGFIVNNGGATCKDIIDLADKVAEIVYKEKGVQLEKEMIIV
ncbi:MAG: UDP-N-acetylmuramate dehydrogenase [Oscillospiraceae bacterium]|nr:UDP-N-acetylmuramate dehydrogenase [Oscillospiraceae bacterium]